MDGFRAFACVFLALSTSAAFAQREKKLLDFGWKFHLGHPSDPAKDFGYGLGNGLAKAGEADGPAAPSFQDGDWRTVNVPHDWAVELPFVKSDTWLVIQHGFKPIGREYPDTSVGWYRRSFDVPERELGNRIWIVFDGVFRNSVAWLNGHRLGREESGYYGFRYDVTDVVRYGASNVLALRADASEYEGWFYEGAGIYRHVWLETTPPVHATPDGVAVTTAVGSGTATIDVSTEVRNDSQSPQTVSVKSDIGDNGSSVATIETAGTSIPAGESRVFRHKVKIAKPNLWSVEDPHLYTLITTIGSQNAKGVKSEDQVHTKFGIRSIRFDADKGFFLNGKHVEIKGMCNHQDHAGVGSALPDALQYYRIRQLKLMGCNAYRTSHNPPTPELLQACDELGMLVMDENRLVGTSEYVLEHLERQIRRDRNHPSVIMWSIGNEETAQHGDLGRRIGEAMVNLVHRVDPSRPTTYAGNNGEEYEGINQTVDLRGWNYVMLGNELPTEGPTDRYHKLHPKQPILGSEEASSLATRGQYKNDPAQGFMSSYDTEQPGWGSTAEHWWRYYAPRPYLAGAFVWTGFDYRGEPTPYAWPCISSQFGVLDTCGYPKDSFYYYQSWWSGQDVMHILPHWNWPGKEGEPVAVWVFSNAKSVELFLNGKSLGSKEMPVNGHVEWQVPYAPGALEARGVGPSGKPVVDRVETSGAPTKIVLQPDRNEIGANGEDAAVLRVSVVDAKGRPVPNASNDIAFQVTGGSVIGVGNGNPASHEKDKFASELLEFQTFGWKINTSVPKDYSALTTIDYDDSEWRAANLKTATQIAAENGVAMFRGYFDLPDLPKGTVVSLSIGQIDDEGAVYLNGTSVGRTEKWDQGYTFIVGSAAHSGRNLIAIYVKNNTGPGGLGKGVWVRATTPAPVPHRAVFNGLAQVIVQSTRTPGPITIKATSPGLTAAQVTLTGVAAPYRGLLGD